VIEERTEGDRGAGGMDAERFETSKPGARGLPSQSDGDVITVEVVAAVLVVRAVPAVLVD
jgi:hypothetical protein